MPEATRPRRNSKRTTWRARVMMSLAVAFAGSAMVAAGCGSDGVVGGDCAPGLTNCSLSCVDLLIDNKNCGACGNVCPAALQCASGVCGGPSFDATADGARDGAGFDGADLDGNSQYCDVLDENLSHCHPLDGGNDGTGGDGSGDDGSLDGNQDVNYPDGCAPPFNTAANCGSCGHACTAPNPVCSLDNGTYECVPLCSSPLTECSNRCVNLLRDPQNCGSCGHVCPSNYCLLATCQGSIAGNVMVIGHDFLTTPGSGQQAKLLTNSVFYNNFSNVNLLSFEEYADAAAVTNIKSILTAYASSHVFTLNVTVASTDNSVPGGALDPAKAIDVVLIYDQKNAPAGKMATLGTSWAPTLSQFTLGGGIVIVLDGGAGLVKEMPQFATSAALLTVTKHTGLADASPVNITFPGTIARGMTSVYLADDNSVHFTTSEPSSSNLLYVATDQVSGELVAVHKIVH